MHILGSGDAPSGRVSLVMILVKGIVSIDFRDFGIKSSHVHS